MSLVERVRGALTGDDDRIDAERLVLRLEALGKFLRLTDPARLVADWARGQEIELAG